MQISLPRRGKNPIVLDIKEDQFSMVYQLENGRHKIFLYYHSVDKQVGRIELSPFELRKIAYQGNTILRDNHIPDDSLPIIVKH